jgi:hypothetical protein
LKTFYILAFISSASAILPIATKVSFTRRPLCIYDSLIILSLASISTDIISYEYHLITKNNWPFINLFLILQILVLFSILFSFNKKIWALIFVFFFICFAGYNYYWEFNQKSLNAETNFVGSVFLIAFTFDCYNKIMKELPVKHLYDHPIFWISCGVLFYYTCVFFPYIFNNQFLELNLMDFQSQWTLHNILNIVKNVCLALAIWTNYRMRLL